MKSNRRHFISIGGGTILCRAAFGWRYAEKADVIKPGRLREGDTVALINPAGATAHRVVVDIVKESLNALGLNVIEADHLLDRRGYLAGKDEDRAADVMSQFRNPDVRAILALRGGWGCARILPLLDYEEIRKNPKILVGYSDVTALLLAVYSRSGLVTFHGPVGLGPWNKFTVDYFQRILFRAEAVEMTNPVWIGDNLTQVRNRIQTIHAGKARGPLLGGNLAVLSGIVGSGYLPDWKDSVLFIEDIGEDIYRVDRMLTQLKLAGILDQIRGFIFGKCTDCGPGEGYGSLTIDEVLEDHIKPLNIPAWKGAMIGHIPEKFTVPIGIHSAIDSEVGSIRLLEPAVI